MSHRIYAALTVTALVIAVLGATPVGEAAKKLVIPKNSVDTAQLKKGAVATAKLRNNAVTSVKVKNGSLFAVDFAPGQLPGGPQGPAGPQGEKGPKGDPGGAGLAGVVYVYEGTANDLASPKIIDAVCPSGKKVVGSGFVLDGAASHIAAVTRSGPWSDLTYWRVIVEWPKNVFPQNWSAGAYAICATVTS
jgi:hypothetical protein